MNDIKKIACLVFAILPFFSCAMDNSSLEKVVACQKIQNDLMNYYKNAAIHLTVKNNTTHNFTMHSKNKEVVLAPTGMLSVHLAHMKTTKEIFPTCFDIPETYKIGTDVTLSFLDKKNNKEYALQAALYTYLTTPTDSLSGAAIAFLTKEMQEDSRVKNASCVCYHGEAFDGEPNSNTRYNATVVLQDNIIYSSALKMEVLGVDATFFR